MEEKRPRSPPSSAALSSLTEKIDAEIEETEEGGSFKDFIVSGMRMRMRYVPRLVGTIRRKDVGGDR